MNGNANMFWKKKRINRFKMLNLEPEEEKSRIKTIKEKW